MQRGSSQGIVGFRSITISAISGTNVTLRTDDGWTRTISIAGDVDLTKGGQDIAASDLRVGDSVRLSQRRNADGTYSITALAVVVPSVRGTVSDVTATSFTVTTRSNTVWTITVDGSTTYKLGSGSASKSDVVDGATVVVSGESTGDNALRARSVTVSPASAAGTVKSKTASTIVVETRGGQTVTIHVDGDTTYRVSGKTNATLADISVDDTIIATGRSRADGSLDADTVASGKGSGRGGFGGFGSDGHGRRNDGGRDGRGASPSASPSASQRTS
jgi:hypothetical protein